MHTEGPSSDYSRLQAQCPSQGGTAMQKPGPSLALLPGEGGRDEQRNAAQCTQDVPFNMQKRVSEPRLLAP